MRDIRRATLGELAGLAIDRDLITYCSFTKDRISLAVEKLRIDLSPEDAQHLLQILLSATASEEQSVDSISAAGHEQQQVAGRAPAGPEPTADPHQSSEAEASDTYQKREIFRVNPAPPSREYAPSAGAPSEQHQAVGGDGDAYMNEAVSEEYLDSVLSFALSMNIIEGYTKDRESRMIILRTGATTTGLSYWETLEYLTNSMLYELRPKSHS